MSNNNHNNDDDYEAIFSDVSAESKQEQDAAKVDKDLSKPSFSTNDAYVADIHQETKSTKFDADSFINIDEFSPEGPTDPDIADIDDGIFAPECKPNRASAKKSPALMISVVFLAVAGVAGYVFFVNPSVLNQSQDGVDFQDITVVPNPDVPADVVVEATPPVEDSVVQSVAEETLNTEVVTPQETPATDITKQDSPVVESNNPTEDVSSVTAEDVKQDETAQTPLPTNDFVAEGTTTPALPPSTPVTEPIAIAENNIAPAPVVAPEVPVAETVSVVPNVDPKVEQTAPTSQEQSKPTPQIPDIDKDAVAVTSQEEQKRLDDAKLDAYFDSPEGRMLEGIPAPSLDPNKGGGESIIIVNKKPSTRASKSSSNNHVIIETNDLSAPIISAERAFKLGRFEAAKEMYENLYRKNPKDPKVLLGRALTLQKMNDIGGAIASYEELLAVQPDNAQAIINMSGLMRKEFPAVALNKLLDLYQRYPSNPTVSAQLGVAYAESGNLEDAITYLGRSIALEPNNPLHYFNRAVILERIGKREEAIRSYEMALEVDAINNSGRSAIPRERIYDRLSAIR
jgi:Flp pilus assembly protein TadD